MEEPVMSGNQRNKNPHIILLYNRWEGVLIIQFISQRVPFSNQTGLQMCQWPIAIQLYSVHSPTSNCFFPRRRTTRSRVPFCFRANISSLITSFKLGIDRASNTNLRIKYESKEEIKSWNKRDNVWINYKARDRMRCASVFTLIKGNKKMIINTLRVNSTITRGECRCILTCLCSKNWNSKRCWHWYSRSISCEESGWFYKPVMSTSSPCTGGNLSGCVSTDDGIYTTDGHWIIKKILSSLDSKGEDSLSNLDLNSKNVTSAETWKWSSGGQ